MAGHLYVPDEPLADLHNFRHVDLRFPNTDLTILTLLKKHSPYLEHLRIELCALHIESMS